MNFDSHFDSCLFSFQLPASAFHHFSSKGTAQLFLYSLESTVFSFWAWAFSCCCCCWRLCFCCICSESWHLQFLWTFFMFSLFSFLFPECIDILCEKYKKAVSYFSLSPFLFTKYRGNRKVKKMEKIEKRPEEPEPDRESRIENRLLSSPPGLKRLSTISTWTFPGKKQEKKAGFSTEYRVRSAVNSQQ